MNFSNPKPKRRWFQFSLRTFFILLTVFAMWFGWTMHKAREQAKAVAWVEEMGGLVYYDFENNEEDEIVADAELPGPAWLVDILGIDFMADVVGVRIEYSDTEGDMGLTDLEILGRTDLRGTQIGDLHPLAKLGSLRCLILVEIGGRDLEPLGELNQLQILKINEPQVRDIASINALKKLKLFHLINTPVSKQQISELQEALPNCEIIC